MTIIESIATANPPNRRSQEEAAAFMQRIDGLPQSLKERLPRIYARSGIDYRYSAIEDYGREPEEFSFYPQDWSLAPAPSTADRNEKYRQAILPLVERVGRDALQQADTAPDEITHVVAVSCTGFFAPGIDIELVKRLNLPARTRRTMVGFMGCYAAFNALRIADSFCQAHEDACVLLVCAELCTLHFQVNETLESAVVNALFSDGAAGAVLRPGNGDRKELAYVDGQTRLDDDSLDEMTWDIGDTGFLMGLSSSVPTSLAQQLPDYLAELLDPHGLTVDEVDFWAIHPGGRAIVEKAQEVLGLPDAAVHDSLEVLRLHGNMSSPTVLFVLKRVLNRLRAEQTSGQVTSTPTEPKHGVALAFGPGLTLEGCLLRWS